MAEGKIVKAIAGYYYILAEGKIYECRARGLFKLKGKPPLVGDNVIFKIIDDKSGYIIELLDRKNQIKRPTVANVDLVCLVVSARMPEPNFIFIDRVLAMCEHESIDSIICVSKIDLDREHEYEKWTKIYSNIGYKVFYTSAKLNTGIDELKEFLLNKTMVLAGNSGVGKSSLANAIKPGLTLKVGDVSSKLKKGIHTTRHIELIEILPDSFILDTPGFNELSLNFINKYDFPSCFKEFNSYKCRFSNCLHESEPDCGVKYAVNAGEISMSRYFNYLKLLNEIVEVEREVD
ncbi:MAG: ribosome small subunit-dependent GTPase A [Thermoanaerobacteraceae bacterium]|nr:ribosome small subunit-dependent GTPase A [Thermoanaerobacteraceae bacterium]